MSRILRSAVILVTVLTFTGASALAGSHLWVVNEVFSNADGTIQFIEMWNPTASNETGLSSKSVTSDATGNSYTFSANLPPGSTSNKYLLLATSGFAALPGAPTPDHIIPDNFFSTVADTIQWHVYTSSILSFTAGELPTDGVHSLAQDGDVAPATPKNWPGMSWSQPPGVSDGSSGAPLTVNKILPDGSRLRLFWESGSCLGAVQYHVVYGLGSQLPSSPGGTFVVDGGRCDLTESPVAWTGVPDASGDPDGLFWFLMVADNDSVIEGSWGRDSSGAERIGPGAAGSSSVCGVLMKDVANSCGQ